jgi:hypothetical protein
MVVVGPVSFCCSVWSLAGVVVEVDPSSVAVAPGAVVVVSGGSVEDVVVVDGIPVARGVVSLLPHPTASTARRRNAASRFIGTGA